MTIPELGTLVEVGLRDAWHHEAQSFTPWLAAHLDELAYKIGIPLELEGVEMAVETFSADILARNPQDDTLVLIENQLEGSDHTHLGQIMTYLAGLEAHTIVWVASSFREPHLSALKWLNDHTDESFAFFAVKVKAVRIEDSPIAPVFEVLARPNNWERRVHTIAKNTRQQSDVGQFRREFWQEYVNRFPNEPQECTATAIHWRILENLDLEGIKLVVSAFLGQKEVGVYVRGYYGVDSLDVYDLLAPHAMRLAERTGVELKNSGNGHFLVKKQKAVTAERSNWNSLMDWLHATVDSYEAALTELFGQQN